jgi:hypothetical protein
MSEAKIMEVIIKVLKTKQMLKITMTMMKTTINATMKTVKAMTKMITVMMTQMKLIVISVYGVAKTEGCMVVVLGRCYAHFVARYLGSCLHYVYW